MLLLDVFVSAPAQVVDDNPFDCVKVQLPTLSTHAKSNLGGGRHALVRWVAAMSR